MTIKDRLGLNIKEQSSSTEELSTEMIAFQNNDSFVASAIEVFEKMILLINDKDLNGVKFYKDKQGKALLSKLDSLIYDRFGIRTKQVYYADTIYGVLTSTPKNFNILKDTDIYKAGKKQAERVDRAKVIDDIESLTRDGDSLVKRWIEGVEALDKQLYEEGIYVDLEKARIDNLPKDFVAFCVSNIPMLVRTYKLQADEITAIVLHEIGHAFTHIEYSIYSVRTTSAIIDTIRENIQVKNKSIKETLRIVYEDVLEGNKDELQGNELTVTIKFMNKYIENSKNITQNVRVSTNSEQLADIFATRFGVGEALVSGLSKLNMKTLNDSIDALYYSTLIEYSLMLLFYIIVTGSIITAFGALAYYFLIGVVFMIIGNFIYSIITKGKTKEIKTYEDIKRRYKEIRNEMVKQLRNELPKELLVIALENINRVDAFIDTTLAEEANINNLDRFIRMISFDAKDNLEASKVDELIEDLMSNDLYLASARMRILKG